MVLPSIATVPFFIMSATSCVHSMKHFMNILGFICLNTRSIVSWEGTPLVNGIYFLNHSIWSSANICMHLQEER